MTVMPEKSCHCSFIALHAQWVLWARHSPQEMSVVLTRAGIWAAQWSDTSWQEAAGESWRWVCHRERVCAASLQLQRPCAPWCSLSLEKRQLPLIEKSFFFFFYGSTLHINMPSHLFEVGKIVSRLTGFGLIGYVKNWFIDNWSHLFEAGKRVSRLMGFGLIGYLKNWFIDNWSHLHSAALCFQADSLRSYVLNACWVILPPP